jgi:putative ubiquitin-RnfH superfamily antitoxin RatB of RatAB toxin-antitoxin module
MSALLQITLVYAPKAREVIERSLTLPQGSTVLQAVHASGVLHDYSEIDLSQEAAFTVGVWNRKTTPHQVLRDLDRIEIYRALTVDPKVARRERFQAQGTHRAGLFSKRRPGAKPGY